MTFLSPKGHLAPRAGHKSDGGPAPLQWDHSKQYEEERQTKSWPEVCVTLLFHDMQSSTRPKRCCLFGPCRYFMLVVALHAQSHSQACTVAAHVSERIIVRVTSSHVCLPPTAILSSVNGTSHFFCLTFSNSFFPFFPPLLCAAEIPYM